MRLDLYQAETARNQSVPVSAYDAITALANCGLLAQTDVAAWNAVVGLRNRIVHDYMNIDMGQVITMVLAGKDQFIIDFLIRPFDS